MTIELVTATGKVIPRVVPSDTKTLEYWAGGFRPDDIVTIRNLDQLTSLEYFELIDMDALKDLEFLSRLADLKKLYLVETTIPGFGFLRTMRSLQFVHINYHLAPGAETKLKATPIDLAALSNLKFVLIGGPEGGGVPPLQNVRNRPFISLDNNGIQKLSRSDIEVLKQFGGVSLNFNPMGVDEAVRGQLKGTDVYMGDEEPAPRYIALYKGFESN